MNIVIVNQYALPAGAAGITRHGDWARELVAMGHDVTIIASRFSYLSRTVGRGGDVEMIDGVRFRWLDTGSYATNDSRRLASMLRFMVSASFAGVRLARRPDVVMGSSPQLLAGVSALIVAKRFGVPFIFEVRDPWPSALVDLGAIRRRGLVHRGLSLVEKILYRAADRIVSPMAHMGDRVAEVGEDRRKFIEIPNASTAAGVLPELPPALQRTMETEKGLGRTVILYSGAIGPSNALHEVLEALAMLRESEAQTYERISIVFIGDGPNREALRDQRATSQLGHVFFFDPIPKPVAFAAMKRADFVLVHFAKAEFKRYGMSANKLFDAMMLGRPVLVSTPLHDTPADTVKCGIRYEPGSPASLAGALAAATHLPEKDRAEMGERGQREGQRRYSIEVTSRSVEGVLADLLQRNGRQATS